MNMYLINPKKRKKGKGRKAAKSTKKATRRVVRRRASTKRVVRRKATTTVRRRRSRSRTFKVRGGRSVSLTVRNPRRRGGGMLGLGSIGSEFRALFSKENLTVAGGAVAATVVTQFVLNKTKEDGTPLLPLPAGEQARKAAIVGYSIAIPFAGALAVRRVNPGLSKGMLLGGLVNTLIAAWQQYAGESYKSVTGTKLYLDEGTPVASLGRSAAGYMPTNTMGVTFEPGFTKSAF